MDELGIAVEILALLGLCFHTSFYNLMGTRKMLSVMHLYKRILSNEASCEGRVTKCIKAKECKLGEKTKNLNSENSDVSEF